MNFTSALSFGLGALLLGLAWGYLRIISIETCLSYEYFEIMLC
ncbi:MAG: hypothetical protein R6U04_04460 [Bacteroidales bacterium]